MRTVKEVLALAGSICIAMLTGGSSIAAPDASVVKTLSGRVAGFTKDGVDEYLGIPYAAPPVGGLRWKPPVPPKPWTGTLPALRFASRCVQGAYVGTFATPSQEEDCLYLNIFASRKPNPPGHKKPVMFWIFGGGLF